MDGGEVDGGVDKVCVSTSSEARTCAGGAPYGGFSIIYLIYNA